MTRLLLVDDDPDVLDDLAAVLEGGHEVAVARNGVDALRRVQAETFDAVLLDLAMPDKDGASVVRDMQALGLTLPVLLVSASQDLPARAGALGVEHWLAKPFTIERLEAAVAAVLAAAPSTRARAHGAVADPPRALAAASAASARAARPRGGEGAVAAREATHAPAAHFAPTLRSATRVDSGVDPDLLARVRAALEVRNDVLAELQHVAPDGFVTTCARRLGVLAEDGAPASTSLAEPGAELAFLDFCTFAFESRGRGAVDLARAQRKPRPGTLEHAVFDAMALARFSLWEVQRRLGDDGAVLLDLATDVRVRVLDPDVALPRGALIAGRVARLADLALLTAPCLTVPDAVASQVRHDLLRMKANAPERLADAGRAAQTQLAAWLLRTCFEAGAAHRTWPQPRSVAQH